MTRGRVIILNGVGSAGKSSIVQALRPIARPGLRVVTMDDHLATLPAASFGTPDGLRFVTRDDGGAPSTEVIAGPLVAAALDGMWREVAALAAQGDVVVDVVLLAPDADVAIRRALPDVELRWVAIKAPLAIVEQRERTRGDRVPGLARWQHGRVHRGRRYDLAIDTASGTPAAHAATLRDAFDL